MNDFHQSAGPSDLPVVILRYLVHRNEEQIRLDFPYNLKVKQAISDLPAVRWSATHRCFYMARTRANVIMLAEHLSRKGISCDITPLKTRPTDSVVTPSHKPNPEKGEIHKANRERLKIFKRYLEQQRYGRSTVKSYLGALYLFFAAFPETKFQDITLEVIEKYNYRKFIRYHGSYSAQNQFISAIKLFFRHTGSELIVPEDIPRPKKIRRLPNVLTKTQVRAIISSTGNLKHRCLLSVVYGSGLRIGEALNLKLTDVLREQGLLNIIEAKGRKDRRVPLSRAMIDMIDRYLAAYRPRVYLFEGQQGGKYSHSSSQKVFRKASRRAGIKVPVTLHTLRHSYATHLLEAGVGLRYIQEILGHNSPKTTMIYTHVSGKNIKDVSSPFDDLGI